MRSLLGNVLGYIALHEAPLEVLQGGLNVLPGEGGCAHHGRLDVAHPGAEEAAAHLPICPALLTSACCLLLLFFLRVILCKKQYPNQGTVLSCSDLPLTMPLP